MNKLLILLLLIPMVSYGEEKSFVCDINKNWSMSFIYDSVQETLKHEREHFPYVMKCKKDDWEMICSGRAPNNYVTNTVYVSIGRKDLKFRYDTWFVEKGQEDYLVSTYKGQCRILENQF
jgi:hypothetical protein